VDYITKNPFFFPFIVIKIYKKLSFRRELQLDGTLQFDIILAHAVQCGTLCIRHFA
jgi:hypothetical protein